MKLTLPVPPSANDYWRAFRGRVVVSDVARRYKQGVKGRSLTTGRPEPLAGPVVVSLVVYRAAKRGDLDNFQKVLLDALKGVAFVDDSQVVEIHARREDDKANPRVEVCVEPAAAEVPARPRQVPLEARCEHGVPDILPCSECL